MITFLLFILLSFTANAMDIGLVFDQPSIKQGEIIYAKIKIDTESLQEMSNQKLKGKTLGDTIYIYDLLTLVRKEGKNYFEADAKVIFLKVPEKNQITVNESGHPIKIFWDEVEILPTQEEKSFLYGTFKVPQRLRLGVFAFIFLGLIITLLLGFPILKKRKLKKQKQLKLLELKVKLLESSDYQQIVDRWMERQIYLAHFPVIEPAFRKFEQTLFKYQFKPMQSLDEKNQVCSAYQDFIQEIKGSIDGV